MLNVEKFSLDCWSTPNVLKWNTMTRRGINNRCKQTVIDCSIPYPVVCTHTNVQTRTPYGPNRGYSERFCTKCNQVLSTIDSTD